MQLINQNWTPNEAVIIRLYLTYYESLFEIQGSVGTLQIVTTCSAIILLLTLPSSCFYTKHTTYHWQPRYMLQPW